MLHKTHSEKQKTHMSMEHQVKSKFNDHVPENDGMKADA
jgi:hypothetical protein